MSIFKGRKRWLIVLLLFFLSTINYLDRQSLSVLAPTLREKLSFSVGQYSYRVSTFLVAYTIGYLFSGRILDRLGTRAGVAIAISFWSAAACLHAAARSWRHLLRLTYDLSTHEYEEFHCCGRDFDVAGLRHVPDPPLPGYRASTNRCAGLNAVCLGVEAAEDRRCFLLVDSVVLSAAMA
mgnify:CR=1 FL=1